MQCTQISFDDALQESPCPWKDDGFVCSEHEEAVLKRADELDWQMAYQWAEARISCQCGEHADEVDRLATQRFQQMRSYG